MFIQTAWHVDMCVCYMQGRDREERERDERVMLCQCVSYVAQTAIELRESCFDNLLRANVLYDLYIYIYVI